MATSSVLSLRRVLAWAIEQGMVVRDQLSEEQLAALGRVFSGSEPWTFEHYQPLRAFGYALARLNLPDLPAQLNVGDALRALDDLRAEHVPAWPTQTTLSASCFAELGYATTSAGITRLKEANNAAWREHANSNRQLLLRGAELAGGNRAVVVGAGKLYDIPLRKLAERFEHVLLVDIDGAALAESVEQVGLPAELRARLSLVQTDVTGINEVFLARARDALSAPDETDVYAGLLRLLHGYRVDVPPRLFPEEASREPIDFACSSMVLSQLATPLTQHVQEAFARRFPASERTRSDEFQLALSQFTHRLQLDHVRALLAAAPYVALSSDTADQYTTLDRLGNLMLSATALPLLGAPTLNALVPRLEARPAAVAEWQWRHIVPTRSKPHGRTVYVAGLVAQRISASVGALRTGDAAVG